MSRMSPEIYNELILPARDVALSLPFSHSPGGAASAALFEGPSLSTCRMPTPTDDSSTPVPDWEWDRIEQLFDPPPITGGFRRVGALEVVKRLGAGGVGLVFCVRNEERKNYALKVLRPSRNDIRLARLRFKHGSDVARTLTHDRLVKVWTVGELGEKEQYPYLVMDFLAGENLAEKLKAKERLPWPDIHWIACELAEGLQFLHTQVPAIFHRDVKPSNVWLLPLSTGDGWSLRPNRLKLFDFDFLTDSTIAERGSPSYGALRCGSLDYGAPETFNGYFDAKSDLWSMGVLLYQLCTGDLPFVVEGDQTRLSALIASITNYVPVSARKRNREIPPWFSKLISHLLQKKTW